MTGSAASVGEQEALRLENARLKEEVESLKAQLAKNLQSSGSASGSGCADCPTAAGRSDAGCTASTSAVMDHGLSKEQVERYARHIVLGNFGVHAQARLCAGSVLVIGCGGLGSPAAIYLAACGVGRIGLVDRDTVDLSNLHRQVVHPECRVGMRKVDSAAMTLRALNSGVAVDTYAHGFYPSNALDIVSKYDVVVDATDNPATRYLINDACVAAGKPLVSAAAVGTDGQLTVYAAPGQDVPCYRCLFPEAPAKENCARCADAGVLGVVPGIMGTLQVRSTVPICNV